MPRPQWRKAPRLLGLKTNLLPALRGSLFPRRNGEARVRIILRAPLLCLPGFAETIQRVSGRRAASSTCNITSADLYRPFLRTRTRNITFTH